MKFLFTLVLFQVVFSTLNKTLEYKVYKELLQDKDTCFLEKLWTGQEIFVKYSLNNFLNRNNETLPVNMEIKFTNSQNKVNANWNLPGNSNNLTIISHQKGIYQLCFKLKGLERRFVTIILDKEDLRTRVLFQKSDIDNYKAKLDKIEFDMNEARSVQIYFKIREEQFYQTMVTIDFRLFWSQILFLLVLIITLFLQQILVKRFSENKGIFR